MEASRFTVSVGYRILPMEGSPSLMPPIPALIRRIWTLNKEMLEIQARCKDCSGIPLYDECPRYKKPEEAWKNGQLCPFSKPSRERQLEAQTEGLKRKINPLKMAKQQAREKRARRGK